MEYILIKGANEVVRGSEDDIIQYLEQLGE